MVTPWLAANVRSTGGHLPIGWREPRSRMGGTAALDKYTSKAEKPRHAARVWRSAAGVPSPVREAPAP
jgi:hypothetical protein